jgi:hypothetical protein
LRSMTMALNTRLCKFRWTHNESIKPTEKI